MLHVENTLIEVFNRIIEVRMFLQCQQLTESSTSFGREANDYDDQALRSWLGQRAFVVWFADEYSYDLCTLQGKYPGTAPEKLTPEVPLSS